MATNKGYGLFKREQQRWHNDVRLFVSQGYSQLTAESMASEERNRLARERRARTSAAKQRRKALDTGS